MHSHKQEESFQVQFSKLVPDLIASLLVLEGHYQMLAAHADDSSPGSRVRRRRQKCAQWISASGRTSDGGAWPLMAPPARRSRSWMPG
jgi:hypothetical protein